MEESDKGSKVIPLNVMERQDISRVLKHVEPSRPDLIKAPVY
jgi:hypothetical protein